MYDISQLTECVVRIHKIHVPSYVENGTNSNIVLDCVYTLDAKEDWQLVVKWWWNDDPVPIYQWIPEFGARTASGRYEHKINLDYFIETGDALTKYRAINILSPTTDLSGVYRCDVSSMKSQASKESVMIVYGK
ncbi:hypothetical protein B4U80_03573 [Leptotrombidium deliense]|uniref:Ig-like domain-containing protein n=1 Tax=Leptotrombidium deliense TaxID=299467 RepID=A0A443SKK4_9ACAR|nr:hypothetical protein B4U80_03573 [Leptotrombidium deliense]